MNSDYDLLTYIVTDMFNINSRYPDATKSHIILDLKEIMNKFYYEVSNSNWNEELVKDDNYLSILLGKIIKITFKDIDLNNIVISDLNTFDNYNELEEILNSGLDSLNEYVGSSFIYYKELYSLEPIRNLIEELIELIKNTMCLNNVIYITEDDDFINKDMSDFYFLSSLNVDFGINIGYICFSKISKLVKDEKNGRN